jgi:phosphoribosyl 1,2-cyclic phosphodiesterase
LRVTVLGSGSRGNAIVVDGTLIVVTRAGGVFAFRPG